MSFEKATTLRSRTYLGLLLAQFLAAFNDQASHIVAIFYAGDMLVRFVAAPGIDEKLIVSVVTACFISPFFLFSPLAGMLADKFSKQKTLIFWKIAEVAMMGLATAGFLIPHFPNLGLASLETQCVWSSVLVVSAVFLMGTHSAFFVPAKYGVMPEILHPTVLSRGNGLLEGTSFVAQILGTSVGGYLYGLTKSTIDADGALSLGREYLIGFLLLSLAVVGAIASFLIKPMPAANPSLSLTWKLWRPLRQNIGILLRSRPLALAVLGIAFFACMTLFLRQTLIYEGDTGKELAAAEARLAHRDRNGAEDAEPIDLLDASATKTQRAEFKISLLIAMVGLGVGIGSLLAGYLSGDKVELGLVPIGAVFLILFTAALAFVLRSTVAMVPVLILIGIAAGLYIVPLYTLLQHRAPKDSKGNLVATSNFINVAGGLIAIALFYLITAIMEPILGIHPSDQALKNDPELLPRYIEELRLQTYLPSALCMTASLLTVAMVVILCRQLPDFLVRAVLWLRSQGRYHLTASGVQLLPTSGPAILATNCARFEDCMHIVAATDRYIRFFLFESPAAADGHIPLERFLARQTGLVTLRLGSISQAEWDSALNHATQTLAAGEIVGVTTALDAADGDSAKFLRELLARMPVPVYPVHCSVQEPDMDAGGRRVGKRRARVVFGPPLTSSADRTGTAVSQSAALDPSRSPEQVRQALCRLAER